jgi:ribosomal protein L7/L12
MGIITNLNIVLGAVELGIIELPDYVVDVLDDCKSRQLNEAEDIKRNAELMAQNQELLKELDTYRMNDPVFKSQANDCINANLALGSKEVTKIPAIKRFREMTGLSLKFAKDIIEQEMLRNGFYAAKIY